MTEPGRNSDEAIRTDDLAKHAEQTPTPLDYLGGPSELAYMMVPIVAFVIANASIGLQAGIWSAVGSAVAITVLRLVRKEPIESAISGLIGVVVASLISYQTGSADGYFLMGIWSSLVLCVLSLVSVLVRWPLTGVIWNLLNGHGHAWREDKPSRRGYDIATLALVAVFAARFVVQQRLYGEGEIGWLAFARIVMGCPLFALALLVVFWAVRRSDERLKALPAMD